MSDLRDEHEPAAVEGVGHHAAEHREDDDRHDAHEAHDAQRDGLVPSPASSETCQSTAAPCIIEPAIEMSCPIHSSR
jgi:hypothetical protein